MIIIIQSICCDVIVDQYLWRLARSKLSAPSMMFQDRSYTAVGFPSCWRREKSSSDGHTQTSAVLTNEAETQTATCSSTAVQTDEEPERPYSLIVDNSAPLKEFLQRVEPAVSEQLRRNAKSTAFDGYKVEWEEQSSSTSCVHTLTKASLNSEFHCTGLAWNCTGSVLGAVFGHYDHDNWCSHKSMLCTWNLDRKAIDNKKAHVSIDVASCVMCLAFHPEQPAVVAGGLFSGEVMVWNTGMEGDPLIASSGMTEAGHKEPVAEICWVPSPQEERRHSPFRLLTLGSDGHILVWHYQGTGAGKGAELRVVQGYRLLTESVPRSLRVGRARGDVEMGGASLSFSHEDKSLLVVGCENGCVLKCSVHTDTDTGIESSLTAGRDFQVPVKFAFRPHHGPVYGCSCSPYHRNLFLTCSTDMSARLYSLLDSSPLLSIEPGSGYLFSLQWSPSRPMVFAVGTGDGHVVIYDLKVSHITPQAVLEASPHRRAVCTIQYNQRRPQFLASGDASGVIKVWRLSSLLTTQAPGEADQLAALATAAPSTATL